MPSTPLLRFETSSVRFLVHCRPINQLNELGAKTDLFPGACPVPGIVASVAVMGIPEVVVAGGVVVGIEAGGGNTLCFIGGVAIITGSDYK